VTVSSGQGSAPQSAWRRRATPVEVAAVAGLVSGLGWIVSLRGLLASPGLGATQEEIAAYYTAPGAAGPTGVYLGVLVVSTLAFLWFVGVVRSRLGPSESPMVGTVFLGGSVVMAGLLLLGAAAVAAPAFLLDAGGQVPDPGAAQLARATGVAILVGFTPRVATLIMFTSATLSRRAQALPRWMIVLTYLVGVVEFVNVTVAEPVLYVFPAWVALVSTVLLLRHDRLPSRDSART
jgi:hypothetical protein